MQTSDQSDCPADRITLGNPSQGSNCLDPVGAAVPPAPHPPDRPHWSKRIKRSDPADLRPDLYPRLFQQVLRDEPYDIANAGIHCPAPVEGSVEPADVDAMLSYLEAVLVSLEQHTIAVIVEWPDAQEAPLLIAGETLKQHLDRVLGVLKRIAEPQRQRAAVRLASIVRIHYRAWLELVEHWKGEFPGLLPLYGYYPEYVYPATYYRAVSDTRDTDRPFDRWTTCLQAADADLRWRHDEGPCPGIISITTHHAIGPFLDTGFAAEIGAAICCEHMIAAARNDPAPGDVPDRGEYFIDALTQMHCTVPGMAWPRDINDVMVAEMPSDASWTPEKFDQEPTSFPDEHLDDGWWAPQLRLCLREVLPVCE